MLKFLRSILFLALFAPLGAQVAEFTDKKVERIDVIVERASDANVNASTVRSKLKTKVGEPFSQLDFDEDLKHLSGDFDRVEPQLQIEGDEVAITLKLWPKPTIRSIKWVGNDRIRAKRLARELDIKPKTIFDRAKFNQAFHKVQDFYIKKGYFQAELSYEVIQDPGTNQVDIEICIDEGRAGHVKRIVFQGITKKEESALFEMIRTKKHFFLTSWMTHAGTYHREMVDADRYIVLNYLQNEGYCDATVELDVVEPEGSDGLILVFRVDHGEVYRFGNVSFDGNTLFSDEQIGRKIAVRRGDPYSPDNLRESVKELTDMYGEKGYIEAIINYEPHLVGNESIYDVHFSIVEGDQYRVGCVKIFGNDRTQQGVLRHESQLCPGSVFDIRKLQATEATLRNIGYFDNVNVYAVRSGEDRLLGPKYRDVHIEVEEKGTGTFGLTFGYSSLENVFAGIEIVERNFCAAGVGRLITDGPSALRGGGEYAQLRTNLGRKQTTLFASWTKPFFNDTPWIVGFDFERSINKRVSDDYTLNNTSVSAHATYPINTFLRFNAHYRLGYLDVHIKRNKDQVTRALRAQGQNSGAISAVGAAFTYDATDFLHTSGLRSILQGEYAGVYGDYYFLSFSYLNTYYLSLRDYAVLKLRGEARFIQPVFGQDRNNVPLGERLYLGGETTMRGFAPYSVGPVFAGDTARGGFSSVLVSAELMRKFAQQLDMFVFVDGGYVSFDEWRLRHLEWSVGVGARLNLMQQIPMIFGLGFPLNPDRKSEVQRFFFSLGGRF